MTTFNPPPGWAVTSGWTPPHGWEPDPGWPPAPAGWNLWLDEPAPVLALTGASAPVPSSGIEPDPPGVSTPDGDEQLYEATLARLQSAANKQFMLGSLLALGGLALTRLSPYLLGGGLQVVYWGAMLVGGYRLLQAVVAHASAPSEARKIVAATPRRGRSRAPMTDAEILKAEEAARRAQAEREERDAEQRARFATLDVIPALLADDELARQASKIKRMYGAAVCVSFLKRKAAERGFGDVDVTEADIPDSF